MALLSGVTSRISYFQGIVTSFEIFCKNLKATFDFFKKVWIRSTTYFAIQEIILVLNSWVQNDQLNPVRAHSKSTQPAWLLGLWFLYDSWKTGGGGGGGGYQFLRMSKLFGPTFCISILKVLWAQILRHSLDFGHFSMNQEYFSQRP